MKLALFHRLRCQVTETGEIILGQNPFTEQDSNLSLFSSISWPAWPGWLALNIRGAVQSEISSFSQLSKAPFAWLASLVAAAELPPVLFQGLKE